MVGMESGFENLGDEPFGMGAMFGSPSNDSGRVPIEIGLMGLGKMLF
jgi:hypothetical protein